MVRTLRGDSNIIKIALLVEDASAEGQHQVTAVHVTKASGSRSKCRSVLNSCLKNAVRVLTKYFPSTRIFRHQINHPLCLHNLVQRQENDSDTNDRLIAQEEKLTTLPFVM